MGKLIVLIGVPLSGKTTWAKDYLNKNKAYYVSRDSERESCFGAYRMGDQREEDLISEIVKNKVFTLLKRGDVILDNTHCKQSDMENIASIFGNHCDIEFVKIEAPTKTELIKRNQKRFFETGKLIPERVLHKKLKELGELVIPENIYLKGCKTDQRIGKFKYNAELKDCVVFDLDGTISLMNGRNPFSGKDCHTDCVNQSVKNLLECIPSHVEVFIFSGRNSDDGGVEATKEWLQENNVPYDHLIMRGEKDHRPDTAIKREMYNTHIKDKYNVLFTVDDRDCIVDLWRSLGIDCFQVYYGNF